MLQNLLDVVTSPLFFVGVAAVVASVVVFDRLSNKPKDTKEKKPTATEEPVDYSNQTIPEKTFSLEELQKYKGSKPNEPVYVGVDGIVFDVSSKRDVYGASESYGLFAGTDGTRALAKSSLNPEDLKPFGSKEGLTEKQLKTLVDWGVYYKKRYPAVGKLTY
jgi:predicted heme/steroid binding protein